MLILKMLCILLLMYLFMWSFSVEDVNLAYAYVFYSNKTIYSRFIFLFNCQHLVCVLFCLFLPVFPFLPSPFFSLLLIIVHFFVADGELYMWGKNSNGQLGLGKSNDKYLPHCFKYSTWFMLEFFSFYIFGKLFSLDSHSLIVFYFFLWIWTSKVMLPEL